MKSAPDVLATGYGQESRQNDSAKTELTPSSRAAIREQALKLLANPRGLSPEVIEWARRWSK